MRNLIGASILCVTSSLACAQTVNVSDDLSIRYQTAGHGPVTILLVPGWTMSSDVFEHQLKQFENSRAYTVIAYDPRSQGDSSKTTSGNFYEQHGRDLANFIATLKLDDIVLGGWSNGGFDVLSYVHQYGASKLKALVMIDAAPAGVADDNKTEWAWFRRDDADGYRQYFTQGALQERAKLNDEFARWMVESPTPAYLSWVTDIADKTSNETAAILNESSSYQNYTADLKGLDGKIPLLYFTRQESATAVRNWSRQNTPSATIAEIPRHLSFWEKPEPFNRELEGFLKANRI